MRVVCVIPARLESTRLPGKVLLAETGKPLICHTIEAAQSCKAIDRVIVATDSDEVDRVVWDYCDVSRTRPHNCGTDRIAEVAKNFDADLIVALQADEPEIKPEHIEALVNAYQTIPGCDMATLATHLDPADAGNPNVVKVRQSCGFATNFFRYTGQAFHHLGLYCYSPRFLSWFASQPRTESEERMSLEQMRALDNGCRIRVAIVDHPYHGIDTHGQYDAFVARWKAKHNG